MRHSTSLVAAALPLLFSACGGTFITTTGSSDDGGPGGEAGNAGTGAGGRASGGRASTGGRLSTGGRQVTGGFSGAGLIGPGGFVPTGGVIGAGGGFCGDCSYLDDACHLGACVGDFCQSVPVPDGQPCEDGSLCTSGDSCRSGVCVGSASIGCPQPANRCQTSTCDPSSGSCVIKNLLDGQSCDDDDPCTTGEACFAGLCAGTSADCGSSDGCCPSGCDSAGDSDCSGTGCTNVATSAVGSSSGGGVSPTRGPEQMNDGLGRSNCGGFHWVFNSSVPTTTCGIPPCEWIELSWANPITIASMYIETEPATGQSPCGLSNRNLAGGTVQYFSNNQWHDVASLSNFIDDVRLDFGAPVTTNRLRVANVVTGASDIYNSVIYEWHVYPQPGCKPPP